MTSDRAPTIEDVAAAAHVSRSTVSRVINRDHRVSAGARDAVTRAIDDLRYTPDTTAQALARRRGHAPPPHPEVATGPHPGPAS